MTRKKTLYNATLDWLAAWLMHRPGRPRRLLWMTTAVVVVVVVVVLCLLVDGALHSIQTHRWGALALELVGAGYFADRGVRYLGAAWYFLKPRREG